MVEALETDKKNTETAGWFFGIFFGALLVLIGDAYLSSASRPVESVERKGTLISASDSNGRRGNNTTLVFEDRYGERHDYEVKSSIKMREISRIRARARELRGQKVIYTVSLPIEELLSVRTQDGEEIVSREHTLAAKRFTGWGIAISGFVLMILSFVRIVQLGRRTP